MLKRLESAESEVPAGARDWNARRFVPACAHSVYAGSITASGNWLLNKDTFMQWETPRVEEICLSCEINSYSNGDF